QEQDAAGGEGQAAVAVGRAAVLEQLRQAVAHAGLPRQHLSPFEVKAGGAGAALFAPQVEQPLEELALVGFVAREGQQLVPGLDYRAGRCGTLHTALRNQAAPIWVTADASSPKIGAY